jgi:hypothetical protein
MSFFKKSLSIVTVFFLLFQVQFFQLQAQDQDDSRCIENIQQSGAHYQICVPENWNGQLIIYAHGAVPPQFPVSLPYEAPYFKAIAFSTGASYRTNGLSAADSACQDIIDVISIFTSTYQKPSKTFIIGLSLGSLPATWAVEKYSPIFDGAIVLSGVHGSFIQEVNYIMDARVAFDYFFPDVIEGHALDIPLSVLYNWESIYIPRIIEAVSTNPAALGQFLAVSKIPVDVQSPESVIGSILEVLSFNVLFLPDFVQHIGGNPFDNNVVPQIISV